MTIKYAFKAMSGVAKHENESIFGVIPQSIKLTCLFGAFVFLQFTVLALANHAGEGYLTPVQRDRVYYALQVFVILGYLLHGLFFHFGREKRIRKAGTAGAFSLFLICVTLMLTAGTASLLNVVVSMIAVLCLGGIGGAVHYRMSLETGKGRAVARCMGFGSAAAVLFQYLLQIRWDVTPLLPVFLLAAFLLTFFLLSEPLPEGLPVENSAMKQPSRLRMVFSVLIAASFILFTCFYNETIHHLMIRSNYAAANVYSWPRLILIPGYLLFALIGDRRNGRYVPVASLCVMLAALLNVVLTGEKSAGWFNMCLFYLSIAAFTSYYLLTFWRLAPGTKHPALWAPMGRMLDSAMVLLTGVLHLSTLPMPVVLGVDIAGVALVILLMAVKGDFNLFDNALTVSSGLPETNRIAHSAVSETFFVEKGYIRAVPEVTLSVPEAASAVQEATAAMTETKEAGQMTASAPERLSLFSPMETLNKIRETYNLTPRESDVLRELVLTEDTQAAIADRLHIQVKSLQTYVTRLYRKTGASTRAGLTDLYHECRNG